MLSFSALTKVSRSTAGTVALRLGLSRSLSTQAMHSSSSEDPVGKLRHVLHGYRQQNFGQTLFSRFIKEMIAAADTNHDGKISLPELQALLVNIGADAHLTSQDLTNVMQEFGTPDESGELFIFADDAEQLILDETPFKAVA